VKKAGLIAGIVVALAIGAAPAAAKPGDLYIAGNEPSGSADVVRMDPKTGDVAPVAELPDDGDADHAAFGADGFLYVTDEDLPGIFRVNVKTGQATLFSDDADFVDAWALDVAPDGQLLLGDFDAEAVFGLRPPSQAATALVTDPQLGEIEGIAAAPNGKVYGTNFDDPAPGVLGINLKSGSVQILASFAGTDEAESITVAPDSKTVYVSRHTSIQSYTPKTDATHTISSDLAFDDLFDLELGFDGKLYVVDEDDADIYKVNPRTGATSTVGNSGQDTALGIAVQPPKCAGKFATVVGTNKKDKIKGSKGPDIIAGLKGNDKIKGLKGKDRLCGGAGKDKLIGGPSKDKIKGGAGKDVEKQ
jgi:Ca2+-binding RTX toxin-like protein